MYYKTVRKADKLNKGGILVSSMDRVFKKEFREMVRFRNLHAQKIKLSDIPMLDKEIKEDMSKLVYIKGIDCNYFKELNKKYGFYIKKREMQKRQLLSDGSFRLDEKGNYVYDIIKVPNDSVIIASPTNIKLRYGFKEEGFGYIDYVEREGKRYYYYIIPRKYVFRVNVLALIVSNTRRKVFYKGCKVVCQDGVERYVYIIPYKNVHRADTKILRYFVGGRSLEDALGYMYMYIKFFEHTNMIFNIDLSFLEDGENLTLKEYEGTIEGYDFIGDSFEKEDEEDIIVHE